MWCGLESITALIQINTVKIDTLKVLALKIDIFYSIQTKMIICIYLIQLYYTYFSSSESYLINSIWTKNYIITTVLSIIKNLTILSTMSLVKLWFKKVYLILFSNSYVCIHTVLMSRFNLRNYLCFCPYKCHMNPCTPIANYYNVIAPKVRNRKLAICSINSL